MSAVRTYLEEKSQAHPREWLRRDPRETHPEILELVREFQAGGGFYDDDAERFVIERVGDLPAHARHGSQDRDPLVAQLGHEVYVAKGCLTDEASRASLEALSADGFVPLVEGALEDGARYVVRFGTLYAGQEVPVYGDAHEVRARRDDVGVFLMPKGARTRGFVVSRGPALVRAAS